MKRLVTGLVLAAAFAVFALAASAATPTFSGSVGPSFTISIAKKPTKAGTIKLVVKDKGTIHDFHLKGPGGKEISGTANGKKVSSIATSVGGTGTTTFILKLKKGTYTFACDPHSSSMHGSFTIK